MKIFLRNSIFNIQYTLLHATNLCPIPSHLVRFGAMQELQKEFPDAVTGLSDPTTSSVPYRVYNIGNNNP